jgi:phosphatidate cytidylyltransferase
MAETRKKITSRLLIFFIGIPIVSLLVLLGTYKNHLPVSLALLFINMLAILEMHTILAKKFVVPSIIETLIVSNIILISIILNVSFNVTVNLFYFSLLLIFIYFLIRGIFNFNIISDYIVITSSAFLLLVYPTFFSLWIIKILTLKYAAPLVLVFLLSVFANDSLAWLLGMLFGKNNRGLIAVSPNKSLAGFGGGIFASTAVFILSYLVFDYLAIPVFGSFDTKSFVLTTILGFFTGLASILGDLVESTIKRSCEVKDSGTLMQGRGGILDSIDSIIFGAPVFYLCYILFFL